MHENMEKFDRFDLEIYIMSSDQPEELKLLYDELVRIYGKSLPFISDPELRLIGELGMRNGDVAYRGYAILNNDGSVLLKRVNDLWGDELEKTIKDIEDAYKEISEQ